MSLKKEAHWVKCNGNESFGICHIIIKLTFDVNLVVKPHIQFVFTDIPFRNYQYLVSS